MEATINKFSKIILGTAIFALAVFLFPSFVFGQGEPAASSVQAIYKYKNPPRVELDEDQYLPDADVLDLVVSVPIDNKITIKFNIRNGLFYFTPNVGYKINLVNESISGGEFNSTNEKGISRTYSVVDSMFSKKFFSMKPGEKKAIEEIYILPKNLPSGEYLFRVESMLSTGVSVSSAISEPFKVNGGGKFLDIDKDSCRIIKGEYKISVSQGAMIPVGQAPLARCLVENNSDQSIEADGKIIVRSYQQDFLGGKEYAGPKISLKAKEKKSIDINLPKLTDPGTYHGYLSFYDKNNQLASSQVRISWTLGGDSAKLLAFIMDNDHYKVGEKAQLLFSYTGPSDLYWWYPGETDFDPTLDKTGGTQLKNFAINIRISDAQNRVCGEKLEPVDSFDFPKGGDGSEIAKKIKTEIDIVADCNNPKIDLTIKKGDKTLSSMSGEFKPEASSTKPKPEDKPLPSTKNILIAIVVVVLLAIAGFFAWRKNNGKAPLFISLMTLMLFGGVSTTHALTTDVIGLYKDSISRATELGSDYFVYDIGNEANTARIYASVGHIGSGNGNKARRQIRAKIQKYDGEWLNEGLWTDWASLRNWAGNACLVYEQSGDITVDVPMYSGAGWIMTEGAWRVAIEMRASKDNDESSCGSGYYPSSFHSNKFVPIQDMSLSSSANPSSGNVTLISSIDSTVGVGNDGCSGSSLCTWSWDCKSDGVFERIDSFGDNNAHSQNCTYDSIFNNDAIVKLGGYIKVFEPDPDANVTSYFYRTKTARARVTASCASETDEDFCTRVGKTCGSVTANNCGVSKTVRCGPDSQSCTPTLPAYATSCTGSQTCNVSNTFNACAISYCACVAGRAWNGTSCVVSPYQCLANSENNIANATICTSDNTGLISNQPNWLRPSCSAFYKCEYTCNSSYRWDYETVTMDPEVDPYDVNFYSCTMNPACGSANGQSFMWAPYATNLCSSGTPTPSSFSSAGPWNWTCSNGITQMQSVNCSANQVYSLTVNLTDPSGGINSNPAGINCSPFGNGTDFCYKEYLKGTSVVLTRNDSPVGNYAPSWSGCDSVNASNQCLVTMNANKTIDFTYICTPSTCFSLGKICGGTQSDDCGGITAPCGEFNQSCVPSDSSYAIPDNAISCTPTGTQNCNSSGTVWNECGLTTFSDCDCTTDYTWNGSTQSCDSPACTGSDSQACTAGLGICANVGTQTRTCTAGSWSDWDVCSATAGSPGVETCDGLDDNCNGVPDDGGIHQPCAYAGHDGEPGYGSCTGTQFCNADGSGTFGSCDDTVITCSCTGTYVWDPSIKQCIEAKTSSKWWEVIPKIF